MLLNFILYILGPGAEKRPLPFFVQRLLVQLEHGYQHYIGFEGHKEAVNSLSGKAMAL
ncbi:hypothetical protein Pyn_22197 [Prunus yedoensis var. nudiflora]|uniref:Uncharacterized protein n=1 Tax=Prunus yedoensis var. nudiflora TaxID=2094558 RepID=A0A314ZR85_PRUYE|nr:hypothetical protein Pyn_22197 [Prunus yedoensis var. nudiflora]